MCRQLLLCRTCVRRALSYARIILFVILSEVSTPSRRIFYQDLSTRPKALALVTPELISKLPLSRKPRFHCIFPIDGIEACRYCLSIKEINWVRMTISDTDFAKLQQEVLAWSCLKLAKDGLVLPLPLLREEIGDETPTYNFIAAYFPYTDASRQQFLTANLPDASWHTYLNAVAMIAEIATAPIISKAWTQIPIEPLSIDVLCTPVPSQKNTLKQLLELDTQQQQCLFAAVKNQHARLCALIEQTPDNSWACQITKIEDFLRWRVLGPQPTDPGGEMVLSFGWVETPRARGDFIPQHKKPRCIHTANFLSNGRIQYAIHSVGAKQPIDAAAINQTMTMTQNRRNDVTWQSRLDLMWPSLSLVLPPNNYSFLRRVFAKQPRSVRGAVVRQACFFAHSYGRGHEA